MATCGDRRRVRVGEGGAEERKRGRTEEKIDFFDFLGFLDFFFCSVDDEQESTTPGASAEGNVGCGWWMVDGWMDG